MDLKVVVNLLDENDLILATEEVVIPRFNRQMFKVAREIVRIEADNRINLPDDWTKLTVTMTKVV